MKTLFAILIIFAFFLVLMSGWFVHFLWGQAEEIKPRLATLFNKNEIVDAILAVVCARMSLHSGGIAVIGSKEDAQMLQGVIASGYIPADLLRKAVHDGICDIGREMFEWHRAHPLLNRLDRCLSPEAFGYAMKHGELSTKEIASVRFDHGETPEEYIASAEDLLDKVLKQLAEGTAFSDLSAFADMLSSDEHCSCC